MPFDNLFISLAVWLVQYAYWKIKHSGMFVIGNQMSKKLYKGRNINIPYTSMNLILM
jgi:hypothetical protein